MYLDLDLDISDNGAAASPSPPAVAAVDASPDALVTPSLEPVTPEPTEAPLLVTPPPAERPDVKGTILFTRYGDIWAASGLELRRLTSNRSDLSPTWSPDGRYIYFLREDIRTTSNSRPGGKYTLYSSDVWRMNANGSNKKKVYDSLLRDRRGLWFTHVLQPDAGPGSRPLVVVSDGADGAGPVVLHTLNPKTGKLRRIAASSFGDLGHNDPEWSPDGKKIAYTRNRNKGTTGAPSIAVHTCKSRKDCKAGKTRLLKSGFANPSWSPDGQWLAVESTDGTGRDVAILNSRKGDVRFRLTDDGNSFAPAVSPAGDQIAYLHRDGLKIDLRIMTLDIGEDGSISLVSDQAITSDGAIDADSTPAWYVPRDQLPAAPTPAPAPTDPGAGSIETGEAASGTPAPTLAPEEVLTPP
jgi:Tol biopolymer transport system component